MNPSDTWTWLITDARSAEPAHRELSTSLAHDDVRVTA